MKRITFLLLFIIWMTAAYAQVHCLSGLYRQSTELFPGSVGELNSQDYLTIYTDSIEFDGNKYMIEGSVTTPFESKDDLLKLFACNYDFLYSSENISGEYIKYQFAENIPRVGNDIILIHFNDCGRVEQYIYVDDGLYRFTNSPSYIEANVIYLEETSDEELIIEYAHNIDTNALVYFIEEPEFEIITEQVLVKDAYSILQEIPNEHVEAIAIVYNEYSSCENAVYDTLYEQILAKEGGASFDISPAIFETTRELRPIQNTYEGQGFYERERKDSVVISLKSSYIEFGGFDVDAGCSYFEFYDCINLDFNTIPSKDTIVYNVYDKCADGFISAGKFCYSNNEQVPWVFVEREYDKLVMPANASAVMIPNEYKTIASVRITNKDELDSECIESKYDSISYQKLVTPATTEATNVPAVYETVQYKKYEDGGVIEVVGGEEDVYFELSTIKVGSVELVESSREILTNVSSCNNDAIKLKLVEIGYLDESDFEDPKAAHLAALAFQIDNDLPLGVVDYHFINILEIIFGY